MKKSILVIEENTTELLKLRKILSQEGYEIMTVSDAKTARDICKKIEISYVLGTRLAWNINTSNQNKQGGNNDY
jgi:PleD family two-component response regulator